MVKNGGKSGWYFWYLLYFLHFLVLIDTVSQEMNESIVLVCQDVNGLPIDDNGIKDRPINLEMHVYSIRL
jgi:hypothetical protein